MCPRRRRQHRQQRHCPPTHARTQKDMVRIRCGARRLHSWMAFRWQRRSHASMSSGMRRVTRLEDCDDIEPAALLRRARDPHRTLLGDGRSRGRGWLTGHSGVERERTSILLIVLRGSWPAMTAARSALSLFSIRAACAVGIRWTFTACYASSVLRAVRMVRWRRRAHAAACRLTPAVSSRREVALAPSHAFLS